MPMDVMFCDAKQRLYSLEAEEKKCYVKMIHNTEGVQFCESTTLKWLPVYSTYMQGLELSSGYALISITPGF